MKKSSPRHDKTPSEHKQTFSCVRCGLDNPPQAKFCSECGAVLESGPAPNLHWRSLTVFFCDLVGSTLLAERKGPEAWRELLLAYQACCRRVIHPFGGTIAQFLGDGVLAYFGYPQAYEQDAQRAVESGLCLIEAASALQLQGEALTLRIGIHTGPVIVGPEQPAGYLTAPALGETLHLAARLQAAAQPNTVLLSPTTARRVRAFFELETLSAQRLKGFSRDIPVYRVRKTPRGRSSKTAPRLGPAPLVGRRRELAVGR
jgi:class 3 adenylate cyclase